MDWRPSPLPHHPILYHLCPVQSGTPSHLATSWCNALPFDLVSSSDLLSIFKVRLKTSSVLVIFDFISVCVWCSDTCESCFYEPVIFIPAFCSDKVSWARVLLTQKCSDLYVWCKCLFIPESLLFLHLGLYHCGFIIVLLFIKKKRLERAYELLLLGTWFRDLSPSIATNSYSGFGFLSFKKKYLFIFWV